MYKRINVMKRIVYVWLFLLSVTFAAEVSPGSIDMTTMWIALFAMGFIGILILYTSSRRMKKIEDLHKNMVEKQKEIEHKQNVFLSSITENIHEIVEHTYKEVTVQHKECLPQEIIDKEEQLLSVTNDLIEFLRLKSKKVKVIHEKLNLNNVLNEAAGSACSKFYGSRTELIFDIDNNIPRYLIGDALHLEKALHNLLEYVLGTMKEGEVSLAISMFGNYQKDIELQFRLSDTGDGLEKEAIEKLFIPEYDEKTKQYSGLGLYVAKELISLMGGELSVQSKVGKGTTFTTTIPFKMIDPNNRRNYHLPTKELTIKRVFIVDSNYNSALAIKKMFSYFRHDVKTMEKEEFLRKKVDLSGYDMVVLEVGIFGYKKIYNYLEQVKAKHDTKVIALDSLLRDPEKKRQYDVVDRTLNKPLSQERVFELIVGLYAKAKPEPRRVEAVRIPEVKEEQGLTHMGAIREATGITQQSFSDFSGVRLLIVEDDTINQKVLANILKVSGMDITFADNGRIAVNTLKESDEPFDLVLMDINMPVMDGYTATEEIRKDARFDTMPIVAFTALALESEREKIFKCGMNAYLTKPLNIGKLYTVFEMYLKERRGATTRPLKQKEVVASKATKEIDPHILDIQSGLLHTNRNSGFYMEILSEFEDAYGESAETFAKLVKEHRYEQIKMLCIDMKGLTGTIGARAMYELIVEIHQQILYKKESLLENYIEPYRTTLEALKHEISRYVEE